MIKIFCVPGPFGEGAQAEEPSPNWRVDGVQGVEEHIAYLVITDQFHQGIFFLSMLFRCVGNQDFTVFEMSSKNRKNLLGECNRSKKFLANEIVHI